MDKKSLPHAPGVYLMRDYSGQVIYIGKAKDLAKRVASYFNKTVKEPRVNILVSNIRAIDYIISLSEHEALLLENRLINKIKPKYNVIWRDDKSYPYIALTVKEDFPRFYVTRKTQERQKQGLRFFGPYADSGEVRKILQYLVREYSLRPCKNEFNPLEKSNGLKFRRCLYYQFKQCPAPCLNKITKEEYRRQVENVLLFLEGKYLKLKEKLEQEMHEAGKKKEFEKAIKLRDSMHAVSVLFERIRFRQVKEHDLTVNMRISRGLSQLKKELNLKKVPLIIEAFDISNIHGTASVGSMVRFMNGKPDKKNYRKFKIKTVQGIDDYLMMQEIVTRRYARLLRENSKLPGLVVIDGGKGHLEKAKKALEIINLKTLPVVSIAKEKEEIFIPGQNKPLELPKDSPALHILQHLRDEAHRFAVTFHRKRREAFGNV